MKRAKMSPARAKARALLALAQDCGISSLTQSKTSSRAGSSLRTCPVGQRSGSTPWCESWDGSAMKHFRSLCRQKMSERPTKERGSSWSRGEYPTPSASRYGASNNGDPGDGREEYATKGTKSLRTWARSWSTPRGSDFKRGARLAERKKPGGGGTRDLTTDAKRGMWPTAVSSPSSMRTRKHPPSEQSGHGRHLAAVACSSRWPTATTTDYKRSGAAGYSTASGRHSGTTLTDVAVRGHGHPLPETSKGGKTGLPTADLNPRFVETLMGVPVGWTEVSGKRGSKR